MCQGTSAGSAEDGRLNRLLDYTKFHIGVYLSAGAGLLALMNVALKVGTITGDGAALIKLLVGNRYTLFVSLILMLLAGFAGGVVASACTKVTEFEKLWNAPVGPWPHFHGEKWANIEHTSFWISIVIFLLGLMIQLCP